MFGYIIFLIFTFPVALLIHSVASEKLNLKTSQLFKALIYGVLCSPSLIELGEGLRNTTISLALHALFKGYEFSYMPVIIQMCLFTVGLFIYFKLKGN